MKNCYHGIRIKEIRIYIFFFFMTLSCSSGFPEGTAPPIAGDGWETASMDSVGIRSTSVYRVIDKVRSGNYRGQKSLVIVKEGKLVCEAYFDGYDRDDLHKIFSISKSITSLLIGIAIEKGEISGVSEPLNNLLPQYSEILSKSPKNKITMRDVLIMAPGFEWYEEDYPFDDKRNSHTQMGRHRDWLEFVVSRNMIFEPGKRWVYSTGNSHLLGGIIKVATGVHADIYAEENLFNQLGIIDYKWNSDPMGYICVGGSYGGLEISARGLAKIGQLLLNQGIWKGKQVISKAWIKESTDDHINADNINHYGYQWWHAVYKVNGKTFKAVCGFGYGGQSLQIFPELNLVVVMTSWGKLPQAETLPVLLTILNSCEI